MIPPRAPYPVVHLLFSLARGGLERVVVDLVSSLDRQHFLPLVCTLTPGGVLAQELRDKGIPLLELSGCKSVFDLSVVRTLCRYLRDNRVTIVHTHNRGPNLYGAVAARLARVPVVVHTRHGINRPHDRKAVLMNRVAGLLADRVVAVSQDARRVAIQFERMDPAKIITIHNGIRLELFMDRSPRETIRQTLGFGPNELLVGHVGRLAAAKDHVTILQAFKLVADKEKSARLVLVGDGELRANVAGMIRELGLEKVVTLLGDRRDVPDLMTAFDLFILPSTTEGISITLLEAMAAGLAVVATTVGGNPEVVVDGETGILGPAQEPAWLANAIVTLLRAPAQRFQMGAAGRQRVSEHFSLTTMAQEYQRLYKQLLHAKFGVV